MKVYLCVMKFTSSLIGLCLIDKVTTSKIKADKWEGNKWKEMKKDIPPIFHPDIIEKEVEE